MFWKKKAGTQTPLPTIEGQVSARLRELMPLFQKSGGGWNKLVNERRIHGAVTRKRRPLNLLTMRATDVPRSLFIK